MEVRGQIVGMWELQSRVDHDSSGRVHVDPVMGQNPLGILSFSQSHFAAQFMRRDRGLSAAPTPASTSGNNSAAVDGYDAYFGTYTLNEVDGQLRVRLDASVARANIGKEFQRVVHVSGDRLSITLDTQTPDGTPITRVLTFARLK